MSRIDYPEPAALSERTRGVLERMPPLNIFRMLAHAEESFVAVLRFTGALWTDAELSARRRELAILLVARLAPAEYEWHQHVAIAARTDVTDEQIAAIEAGRLDDPAWDPADRALLALVRDVVQRPRSDDATFATAREHFSDRELVELHLVVGAYVTLARVMTNLDLELDDQQADALLDR